VFRVAERAEGHLRTAGAMVEGLGRGEGVGHGFEEQAAGGFAHGAGVRPQGADGEWAEVRRGFGCLMPAVAARLWLDRLQRVDFDVFRPELRRREWRLPWRAYWAFRRERL
jgi:NADH dehydrogenase [ubiquinone] 1 alpha subcomplex assembly factor 6